MEKLAMTVRNISCKVEGDLAFFPGNISERYCVKTVLEGMAFIELSILTDELNTARITFYLPSGLDLASINPKLLQNAIFNSLKGLLNREKLVALFDIQVEVEKTLIEFLNQPQSVQVLSTTPSSVTIGSKVLDLTDITIQRKFNVGYFAGSMKENYNFKVVKGMTSFVKFALCSREFDGYEITIYLPSGINDTWFVAEEMQDKLYRQIQDTIPLRQFVTLGEIEDMMMASIINYLQEIA